MIDQEHMTKLVLRVLFNVQFEIIHQPRKFILKNGEQQATFCSFRQPKFSNTKKTKADSLYSHSWFQYHSCSSRAGTFSICTNLTYLILSPDIIKHFIIHPCDPTVMIC